MRETKGSRYGEAIRTGWESVCVHSLLTTSGETVIVSTLAHHLHKDARAKLLALTLTILRLWGGLEGGYLGPVTSPER